MKSIQNLKCARWVVWYVCLAHASISATAANFYVNSFNDSSSVPADWNAVGGSAPGAIASWDGSQNSAPPAGGSMYVTVNWAPQPVEWTWQDYKICFGLPNPGPDATQYSALTFDIKIDLAHSTPGTGTLGGVQPVIQNWNDGDPNYNWVGLGFFNFQNTGEWQHLSVPLGGFPLPIDRVVLNLFTLMPTDPQGPMSYWIDNIQLAEVPEPGVLAILGLAVVSLTCRRFGGRY